MGKDIGYVVAQLNRIVIKSHASMKKSLMLALQELPPKKQIQELRKVVNEMDKIHKVVTRLAITRGVAETEREKDRRIKADANLCSIVEKKQEPKPRGCTDTWSNAV